MTTDYGTETADSGTKDGTEGRKTRVRFGPKPHQTVPHEWAERMISHLFQVNRKAFGACLQYAAGIEKGEGGER